RRMEEGLARGHPHRVRSPAALAGITAQPARELGGDLLRKRCIERVPQLVRVTLCRAHVAEGHADRISITKAGVREEEASSRVDALHHALIQAVEVDVRSEFSRTCAQADHAQPSDTQQLEIFTLAHAVGEGAGQCAVKTYASSPPVAAN